MIFPVRHPFYDTTIEQSKVEKYKPYMSQDKMDKFVTPYYFEEKPVEALSAQLKGFGFKINHIELRDKICSFRNKGHLESESSLFLLFYSLN